MLSIKGILFLPLSQLKCMDESNQMHNADSMVLESNNQQLSRLLMRVELLL